MDLTTNTLKDLFDQLGLDSDDHSIDEFVANHQLPNEVKVVEADFWSESQARFLKEELHKDAEWAPVIDDLNVLLHDAPE
ncbi:DUF2789 domain-containing protein [Pseudomonas syringae]|uniref:DUF2789 domain-containing protein n=1 Tax=Pseudomonas syringae TaxID=317 RepID=UPI00215ABD1C|nr:DUF2789 domain-containing protein [Pseudomonas syringae]MCR8720146.1 DUF2789 domain-containing protein [Pseudomonas syringae]